MEKEMEKKMENISCNVIQDLLPSYVDEVCSKDSSVLVREHIAECETCRQKLERMRDTELVSEKLQGREIDYLKKFRRERVGAILLCAVMLVEVWLAFSSFKLGNENLVRCVIVCTGLLLILAAGIAGNFKVTVEKSRMIKGLVVPAALILLQVGLYELAFYCLIHDKVMFLLQTMRIGSLMTAFHAILMAASGALLLRQALSEHKNAYATVINIVGLNLPVTIIKSLYTMETFEGLLRKFHFRLLIQLIFIVAATVILKCYHTWAAKRAG